MTYKSNSIFIRMIQGSRTFNNAFVSCTLFFISLGFILQGIVSYLGTNLTILKNLQSDIISFIPQGLVMSFYGLAGLFISLYIFLTMYFNIDAGYNEFDPDNNLISIFRWGFPGSNRKTRVQCLISDIEYILLDTNSGFGRAPTIALQLKGELNLPLYSKTKIWKLEEIEREAADLAQFLNVPLNNQL